MTLIKLNSRNNFFGQIIVLLVYVLANFCVTSRNYEVSQLIHVLNVLKGQKSQSGVAGCGQVINYS